MSIALIQQRLAAYGYTSTLEEDRAIREITQEVVLAALARFSEDLDFALQAPDAAFQLEPYLPVIRRAMSAYGYDIEFVDRSRVNQAVRTVFLKDDSLGDLLQPQCRPTTGPARMIRIKLEIDANPPAGGTFETRYLDFPFPQATVAHDPPSLFAGKLHALLCRRYLKGRNCFDFIWYTARRTPVNYRLLAAALAQTGPQAGTTPDVDQRWCRWALDEKIDAIDWSRARADVRAFGRARDLPSLEIWGRNFFHSQAAKLAE